jgi:hypothetical protein
MKRSRIIFFVKRKGEKLERGSKTKKRKNNKIMSFYGNKRQFI